MYQYIRHAFFLALILVNYNEGTTNPLVGDTVHIYGMIRVSHKSSIAEFHVNDYVLGRQLSYYSSIDANGSFDVKFPIRNTQDIFWQFNQDSLMRLIVSPRDSLNIVIDQAGIHFQGSNPATNEDLSRVWPLYQREFPAREEEKAVSRLEPEDYFNFRVKQKDKQIKFLESICANLKCSDAFRQWYRADCEVLYYRELLAYGWKSGKYGMGSTVRLATERSKRYKSSFMKLNWIDGNTNNVDATHLSFKSDNKQGPDQLMNPDDERYKMSSAFMSLIKGLSNNLIVSGFTCCKKDFSKIRLVIC